MVYIQYEVVFWPGPGSGGPSASKRIRTSGLSTNPSTNPDADRASLLAELEALADAATAKLAEDESLEALLWDVAERRRVVAAIREHGHVGATWMDDRGVIVG